MSPCSRSLILAAAVAAAPFTARQLHAQAVNLGTGTATVAFRGPDGASVTGDFPATRCGGPYMVTGKGVLYETRFKGYSLLVGDVEKRAAGARADASKSWYFVINGPKESYRFVTTGAHTATFGPGFKSAEIVGTIAPLFGPARYPFRARFTCK